MHYLENHAFAGALASMSMHEYYRSILLQENTVFARPSYKAIKSMSAIGESAPSPLGQHKQKIYAVCTDEGHRQT